MFANIVDVEKRTYAKLPWQADIPKSYRRNAYSIAETSRSAFLPTCAKNGRMQLRKSDSSSSAADFISAVRFSKAALEFILGLKLNFV